MDTPKMCCTWPEGACQHLARQAEHAADPAGRVWMHCEQGLTMTKASMARFMMFCLQNNVEIGNIYSFAPKHSGCAVIASLRIRPDQIPAFQAETGGILRKPPQIFLNSR